MAVNASASNGSVFEDIPTNVIPGDTFCASAELTTADTAGGGGA